LPAPTPPPDPGRRLDDPAWVDDIVASAASRVNRPLAGARRRPPRAAVQGNGRPPTTGGGSTAVLDPADTPEPPTTEQPADGPAAEPAPAEHAHRSLVEWLIVLGIVVLLLVLVRAFLIQPYAIPSASMSPTLVEGDRVAVSPLSYRLGDVSRGDIVVFDRPASESEVGDDPMIKRVIGLPNETIAIENDTVVINGIPLSEPYLQDGVAYPDMAAVVVPPDHVFVLGDNRSDSRDSRSFGPVPVDDISGRAILILWPPKPL
jgi:signal peptidase I